MTPPMTRSLTSPATRVSDPVEASSCAVPPGALGAILAGGRSLRFGSDKALAPLDGRRVIEWVRDAVFEAVREVRVITAEPGRAAAIGAPWRSDPIEGSGPLGGIHAALLWAREEGRPGALCVGCDMPFLTPDLLRAILGSAGELDAVVPRSGTDRLEPLAAYYSISCIDAVERLSLEGDRRAGALAAAVRTRILGPEELEPFGPPARLFMNVNTPAEHRRAEALAAEMRRR